MDIITLFYISFVAIFLTSVIGSSMVFLFSNKIKSFKSKIINGFTSGVMIGASIFGLIYPSLSNNFSIKFLPVIGGIIIGGIFLFVLDIILNKIKVDNKSSIKLFFALTLHNIPEGLAIGLSFSLATSTLNPSYILSALSLAVGIGLQNIPENLALSLSLYESGKSKFKAFYLGILSSVVEPVFALISFYLTINLNTLLPIFLSFAGGAMIYITLDEILLDNKRSSHQGLVWSFIIGFCIMIILETI